MIVMVVVGLHMVQANFNGNVSIRLCWFSSVLANYLVTIVAWLSFPC